MDSWADLIVRREGGELKGVRGSHWPGERCLIGRLEDIQI